eukprot:33250-Chlamydomonas_euryale.AAC.6
MMRIWTGQSDWPWCVHQIRTLALPLGGTNEHTLIFVNPVANSSVGTARRGQASASIPQSLTGSRCRLPILRRFPVSV